MAFSTKVPAGFRSFARQIDRCVDPLEAAIALDEAFHPDLDSSDTRAEVDSLAGELAPRIRDAYDAATRLERLGEFLGQEAGFRGERRGYEDADNSFVHRVLETRRGLPITLSAVYVSVALRLDVSAVGISLPGHFVVGQLDSAPPTFVDPFRSGQPIAKEGCDRIVREVTRGEVLTADRFLKPTSPRTFLTRMLNNLQMVYWRSRHDDRSLLSARLLCVLNPESPDAFKARAYSYDRIGDVSSALSDYEVYLRSAPDSAEADRIRRRVTLLKSAARGSDPR